MSNWKYNDGGIPEGEKSYSVVRAIAIVTGKPYQEVHDALHSKLKRAKTRAAYKEVYHQYILSAGFAWHPVMKIGTGCKMHLKKEELPRGKLICSLSKHFCAVIDGIIQDTHDPSREGTRCVYGYYALPAMTGLKWAELMKEAARN